LNYIKLVYSARLLLNYMKLSRLLLKYLKLYYYSTSFKPNSPMFARFFSNKLITNTLNQYCH